MRGLRRLREAVSGGWSWRSSGLLGPGVLCTVLHTGTDQVFWMMFHVVSNGCEVTSFVGMCFYISCHDASVITDTKMRLLEDAL